jgi:hypothetical protein
MAAPMPGQKIEPAIQDGTGAGWHVRKLYDVCVIGPGKKVDTYPLPMELFDKVEFAEMEQFSGFMHKPWTFRVKVMRGAPILDGSKWGWTPGSEM